MLISLMTQAYSQYMGMWSISFLSAWNRRENELVSSSACHCLRLPFSAFSVPFLDLPLSFIDLALPVLDLSLTVGDTSPSPALYSP